MVNVPGLVEAIVGRAPHVRFRQGLCVDSTEPRILISVNISEMRSRSSGNINVIFDYVGPLSIIKAINVKNIEDWKPPYTIFFMYIILNPGLAWGKK